MARQAHSNPPDLGPVLAEYRFWPVRLKSSLIGGWIGLVLSVLLLVAVVILFRGDPTGQLVCGGLSLFVPVLSLIILWQWERDRHVAITVHEDGLVYNRKGSADIVPWDRVSAYHKRAVAFSDLAKTFYTYTLFDREEKLAHISFDHKAMPGITSLGETIEQEVDARILPGLQERFQAHQPVNFGPLTVSKTALSHNDKQIPWELVEAISFERGALIVRERGQRKGWAKVPVEKIPNLSSFLAIVEPLVDVDQHSLVERARARRRSYGRHF
jgi:hypothetical protein